MPLGYQVPSVPKSSWVAPSGLVSGDVKLGEGSSVWYGAVVRGKHRYRSRTCTY